MACVNVNCVCALAFRQNRRYSLFAVLRRYRGWRRSFTACCLLRYRLAVLAA